MKNLSIYGMIIKKFKESYTMKRNIWQTFKNACVIFSAIILSFYFIGRILFPNLSITPTATIVFFVLSIALAFVNELFFIERFPLIVKCILHFFATLALIIISFAVSGKFAEFGPAILIISFAFSVLYWIGAAIALIVNGARSKKKNKEQKYEKMF